MSLKKVRSSPDLPVESHAGSESSAFRFPRDTNDHPKLWDLSNLPILLTSNCFMMPTRFVRLTRLACLAGFPLLTAAALSPLSAQVPNAESTTDSADTVDTANLYHFNGQGKVCPRIVSLVEKTGGRVDWGGNNQIAFDQFDTNSKHFQAWIMNADGSSPRAVTSLNSTLAQNDAGNPAWHPSGNYLVVQAADIAPPPWSSLKPDIYRRAINPGLGFNNDLWITSIDASHAAALTHLDTGHGVLNPHFSRSGDYLLWSEMVEGHPQKWVMRLAKFRVDSDGPHLTDIKTLDPLNNAFYGADDFSPDDKQILFSTTKDAADTTHRSIVRMDLATGKTKYLTDAGDVEWNENAHYSPDGTKILWTSSRGIEQKPDRKVNRTDVWIMRADGSDPERLTFFNQPGTPEFRHAFNVVGDLSWSPDAKWFAAFLISRIKGQAPDDFTGSILRVTLP